MHIAQQKDFTAKLEDNGADVSLLKDNSYIGIEVTLNDDNILRNISRDLERGYKEVWIVAKKDMLKRIEKKVTGLDKIRLFAFEDVILMFND